MLGKTLVMLFQKTSTRTRVSFEAGMTELGGHAICLGWQDSNFHLSKIRYEARCIADNSAIIMARLKDHKDVHEVRDHISVSLINGCCNRYHPCQVLADMYTIYEDIADKKNTSLSDVRLAYIGVHNNVANSLMEIALLLGVKLTLVCPIVPEDIVDKEAKAALQKQGLLDEDLDLKKVAQEVDYVYVDTWLDLEYFGRPEYADMQQERIQKMMPYQLNQQVLQASKAKILHDMPIHVGYEISEDIVEASPRSLIFQQAANRKHVQKAVILYLLAKA